ncbi:hypothetical protein AAF712_009942 [Marasmius tenuissimus]|uniref:Uncharacterized protein n=1 Tax=Marasmius tenuissimus TaxID=585030 RepID=A0ABR2ZND1_9AGAR
MTILLTGGTGTTSSRISTELHHVRLDRFINIQKSFSEAQYNGHLPPERKIYTATRDARIAFISATDIARVAFRGLVDEEPHNTDYRIEGPEALTYDEIADKLTHCLGVKIEHVKLSEEDRVRKMVELGSTVPSARFIAALEARSDV